MIEITKSAAEQILHSAKESGISQTHLRVAVKKNDDNSLHYAIGFDDAITEDDVKVNSNGIDLVISPKSTELASGMTIDYVELDNNEMNFIFINPNDPNYQPA